MNQEKPISIFINYRRDDCLDEAREICHMLQEAFGEGAILFMDESGIALTDQWKAKLHQALSQTEVMLSLIGPKWVSSFKEAGYSENTNKINDWVQYEIETALNERVDIVPVFLFLDTYLDRDSMLPGISEEVASIVERQGLYIKRGELRPKIKDLINSLRVLMRGDDSRNVYSPLILPHLASLPLDEKTYLGKLYEVDDNGEPKIAMPFLGPVYYSDNEAALYFGRDQEIRQLFHLVRRNRLVLFEGYSGSGKSSLLHAGLLPRMKDIEIWEVLPPVRRSKEEGGLANQLKSLWDNIESLPEEKRKLIILDQVEEMYADPLKRSHEEKYTSEIEELRKLLGKMIKQFPQLHFILAFRSEFSSKIQNEFLSEDDLHDSWDKLYLRSLDAPGIKNAVKGPMQKSLQKKFNYKIREELADEIARDFSGDDYSPHTVLLQVQLVELWKAAQDEAEKEDIDTIEFTVQLYQECQQKDLATFVDEALAELSMRNDDWKKAHQDGLILDVLYRFTTTKGTATSMRNDTFVRKYRHIENPVSKEILERLKQKYLLSTIGKKGQNSRLAHDTLAPVIRAKFEQSDSPGLRAWRIVEAKRSDIKNRRSFRFSESDVQTLIAGRFGMPAQDPWLWEKVDKDLDHYRQLRQRNFDLAFAAANRNVEHLEFDEAITNLETALRENLHTERVMEKVAEVPYPLAFLQNKAKLEAAIQLLASDIENPNRYWKNIHEQLSGLPEENLFLELEEYLNKKDEGLLENMRERFFPNFVKIPGGTFEMGAKESDLAYPQERPAHMVMVSPFQLADTPTTFWQYGLYCLQSGVEIPRDSGFGRGARPVINVSWYEAIAYANWLSKQLGLNPVYQIEATSSDPLAWSETVEDWEKITNWDANGIRLPTDAEWEFAAGGGATDRSLFGNGKNVADPDEMNFDCGHPYNKHMRCTAGMDGGTVDKVKI